MGMKKNIRCISCSIFRHSLENNEFIKENSIKVEFLTSMLHMRPEKLDEKLKKRILPGSEEELTLLLYGDCAPGMCDLQNQNNVKRVEGINCIEILLEASLYRKLRKEGAFFLLPEWAERWREVFEFELGLDEKIGKQFLQDFQTKFVYLDTGQKEVPIGLLNEISAYFGLPYEVIELDAKILTDKIKRLLEKYLYE